MLLLAQLSDARGQNIESVIMPGRLAQGHAKLEASCSNCHVRFNRAAQSGLCLDCHKDIARDVREKAGFHGRLRERECRTCHTDHKGREARLVVLDEKRFDHALTDFALRGRHVGVTCSSCHVPGRRHRDAPGDCASCHRKDDRHKGSLGADCARCHAESGWKETRFDHAKTRFPLNLSHAKVACSACHGTERYKDIARECAACHRKDDAHRGQFGARCESCHDEGRWKSASFSHDRDTHFALRGRHRAVRCDSCHRGPVHREKLSGACNACHARDDAHKGSLGARCEQCHSEQGWKGARFNHDRDTKFALKDRHKDVRCEACHGGGGIREKVPTACVACHERDDRERGHKGRYGRTCEACHVERGWNQPTFVHERDAKFVLRGRHAQVRCDACHKGDLHRDRLATDCIGCHAADDRHAGTLGRDCAGCHTEQRWNDTGFDHARSRFPLLGRHAKVQCSECHRSPRFKDASTACVACHARDDRHRERLGPRCEECHGATSWKDVRFDHDRRSRFPLEGRHVKVACTACHREPVSGRMQLPLDCLSCHKQDDVHLGTYGRDCAECHVPTDWRKVLRREPASGPGMRVPEKRR